MRKLRAFYKPSPEIVIFSILLFSTTYYLANSQSRKGLEAAESTFFGGSLQPKITILCAAFVLATSFSFMLGWMDPEKIELQIKKISFSKSLLWIPNVLFIGLNWLPAILQKISHNPLIDKFYAIARVGATNPSFSDLKQTLYFLRNPNIHQIGDEGFIYPRAFLFLGRLTNFIPNSIISWILILLLAFVSNVAIYLISKKLGSLGRLTLSLLVISPPILLLIERGNIEILIFGVILLVSFLMKSSSSWCQVLSIFLVAIISLIKFYPAVLLVILIRYYKNRRVQIFAIVITVIVGVILSFDLSNLKKFQIREISGSFGFPVFESHLSGLQESSVSFAFIPLFIVFVFFLLFLINGRELSLRNLDLDHANLLCSLVLITSFLTASNYMYRLWPLLVMIPIMINHSNRTLRFSSYLAIFSLFLSPRSTGFLFNLFLLPIVMIAASEYCNWLLRPSNNKVNRTSFQKWRR